MNEDAADGFTQLRFAADGGVMLAGRDYPPARGGGPPAPLPLVCLPGLTRNARDFHDLAVALSQDAETPRRVLAFEFRGRGASDYADPQTYTVAQEARDTIDGLAAAGIHAAAFLGSSRGGIVTMVLAAQRPDLVRAAILNDIGPLIARKGLARIAAGVGRAPAFADWDAAAEALRAAQGEMFPALERDDWLRYARQLCRETATGVVFDYDPALAAVFADAGPDAPLPDLWPLFRGLALRPMMVIRGALSDILTAATVEAMRRTASDLTLIVVDGQGHAPLLWDRPTQDAVEAFLTRLGHARPQPSRADGPHPARPAPARRESAGPP